MDKGDDSPPQPQPTQVIGAQGAANKDTAIAQQQLNMMNQTNPYGSVTYSPFGEKTPEGIQRYEMTQTLNPAQQAILDQSNQAKLAYGQTGNKLLGSVKDMLSQPFTLDQFGAAPTYDEAYRNQQLQNLRSRGQTAWDQRRQALETQLANQGIMPGSEAYNNAFQTYNQGWNDYLTSTDISAGDIAGNEYNRMLASRGNQISEALMPRSTALNELAALMGGSQVSNPTFSSTPQTAIAGTDVLGAYNSAANQQAAANANATSTQNAMMGGLFGLGGAALGASPFWFGKR